MYMYMHRNVHIYSVSAYFICQFSANSYSPVSHLFYRPISRAAESELESESESPESWVFGKAGVGVGVVVYYPKTTPTPAHI